MPGSPASRMSRRSPLSAACHASLSLSTSGTRPTKLGLLTAASAPGNAGRAAGLVGGRAMSTDGSTVSGAMTSTAGATRAAGLAAGPRPAGCGVGGVGSTAITIGSSTRSRAGSGNAATGEYVDLVQAGIIAPAKVTRSALQNAASIAALFLTTEAVIADKPEKNAPAMPGGDGGMGGMDF